jgi:hypothetical protein
MPRVGCTKLKREGEIVMSQGVPKKRPFGVTILAILAGIAAVLAGIHALQSLGILPYVIGPLQVHALSFWNFLMWAIMVYIWVWLIRMLWNVEPQAWLFLAVITVFNLILDFVAMIGSAAWTDVSISFLLNAIILIYVMLPSTKRAFGTDHN